jgi:hypothetical protein
VIYPPQVALVGFGAGEQPCVGRRMADIPAVTASSPPTSVSDGHRGAVFAEIHRLLQQPETL